jgi:hypothetical protein
MCTLTSCGRIFGGGVRKCVPNEDDDRLNPQNMAKKLALMLALMAAVSVAVRSAHGNDQDGPDVPPEGPKVGDELLSWGVAEGIPTLDHKGRVVVSSTNSYVTPPFSIMGRLEKCRDQRGSARGRADRDQGLHRRLCRRKPETGIGDDSRSRGHLRWDDYADCWPESGWICLCRRPDSKRAGAREAVARPDWRRGDWQNRLSP